MAEPAPRKPLAALQMYDWPEIRPHTDSFWALIRVQFGARGIASPRRLSRPRDYMAPWSDPRLLLAQTCGFPYATRLRGRVRLVGTPCYAAEGCRGPHYSSAIVVAAGSRIRTLADLEGATAVVNSPLSQSGYWALRAALAQAPGRPPRVARAIATGSHRSSMRTVAGGEGDVAAIDCVSWALAVRHEPETARRLRVIDRSPEAPGLPFVTAASGPDRVGALAEAIEAAIEQLRVSTAGEVLMLTGLARLGDADYDRIIELKELGASIPFPETELPVSAAAFERARTRRPGPSAQRN